MKTKTTRIALFASLALAPIATFAPAPAGGPNLVLQVKGTAIAETRNIDTDGDGAPDTMADCFDVDLIDPVTGLVIGTATDCLYNVVIESDDQPASPPVSSNIGLEAATFFHLPGGTIVTLGQTTVRPVLRPTSRNGVTYTHITGANGDGGVAYGTGRFANASGQARLSGQVDLSQLGSNNQITFDCIFVIDDILLR